MTGEQAFEAIRMTLKMHQIGPVSGPYNTDVAWIPRKCSGCAWIGWDHDEHLAEKILNVIDLDKS